MSLIIVCSLLKAILAVPCGYSCVGAVIRLITAVVGFGDTGNICSPKSALAKEDFPALKAPNSAIVNVRLLNLYFCFCKSLTIDVKPRSEERRVGKECESWW